MRQFPTPSELFHALNVFVIGQTGESRRSKLVSLADAFPQGSKNRLHATSQHAATDGESRARAEHSAQAFTLTPPQESKPAFETLIGSPEAAKLLGNIHVKTLQRYARTGSLPGYQIGGHWYFRVSELDAWLQSRINSNCQPADLVDFTQEKTQ
jgi:excisionase family DNA binding protein